MPNDWINTLSSSGRYQLRPLCVPLCKCASRWPQGAEIRVDGMREALNKAAQDEIHARNVYSPPLAAVRAVTADAVTDRRSRGSEKRGYGFTGICVLALP